MNFKAVLIGGLLPAILLGTGTVLMKLSLREGSSVPNYLMQVGFAVFIAGLSATCLGEGWISTPRATAFALSMGVAWAGAIGAMAYAVSVLGVPVSVISPLTNSNALVALLLSAVLFDEFAHLNIPRVLMGTLCIVTGAIIVSTAKN